MLSLKGRRPGLRRPFVELKTGQEWFRKLGRWHRLFRRIDHEADRYSERITDAETGEVVRELEEPLSEHRGRGSAKTPGA
jgi:hypothetical protein